MQHAATRGREARWLELRREMGLGDPGDDRRRYGGPAQAWRFDEGRAFLEHAARSRGVPPPDAAELDEARALAAECEGPLRAFLHEDLGNARQTFEVGDELFLLDYEYSRWGPAPLDLCKAMLGKFELNLDDGAYPWNVPGFGPELAAEYRAGVPRRLTTSPTRGRNAACDVSDANGFYGHTSWADRPVPRFVVPPEKGRRTLCRIRGVSSWTSLKPVPGPPCCSGRGAA